MSSLTDLVSSSKPSESFKKSAISTLYFILPITLSFITYYFLFHCLPLCFSSPFNLSYITYHFYLYWLSLYFSSPIALFYISHQFIFHHLLLNFLYHLFLYFTSPITSICYSSIWASPQEKGPNTILPHTDKTVIKVPVHDFPSVCAWEQILALQVIVATKKLQPMEAKAFSFPLEVDFWKLDFFSPRTIC